MLTARAAADLLASAADPAALGPLLETLGFGSPSRLDASARAALGVPPACEHALVARGDGALRALVVDLPPAPGGSVAGNGHAPREAVGRLAARLAARTPHLCWLVVAVERDGPHTVIAAWSAGGDGNGSARAAPRVAALVVDRRRVVDSDADTLRSLAALPRPQQVGDSTPTDLLTHARWLDVLGRDALGRAFYRTLERTVAHLAASLAPPPGETRRRISDDDRRDLALLYVSRLVFLSFLEAKGWLDGERAFLAHAFERETARGRPFHRHTLLPLFFGTLNTPHERRSAAARAFGRVPFLNGGLFARAPVERRCAGALFPDESLGRVFGDLLARYRFTAREDSTTWSEAAIDPEMLGRAFESLMAAADRRATGTFYTPHAIVSEVVTHALREALLADAVASSDDVEAVLRGEPLHDEAARDALRARVASLRVLDPACGSGAFLVHALERLAAALAVLGDARPVPALRRAVLARSIFGVDVSPTAVWLCELRLWLSVVIESDESDPRRVPPLPNLDRNVRIGDSLAGDAFAATGSPPPARTAQAAGRRLAVLRERYARASGVRKRTLAVALDREERRCAVAAAVAAHAAVTAERREILLSLRDRDLFGERHRTDAALATRLDELRRRARALASRRRQLADGAALPFAYPAAFADAALGGGFDAVVGNPPWVRLHHIPAAARAALRRDYVVFRDAAWTRGAEGASAGHGFSAQVDLSALFVERSLALLRPAGTLALLLPAKLWKSLAGGGVRTLLGASADLIALEDWSDARAAFDAATYPSLLVARRRGRDRPSHDELPLAPAPASSRTVARDVEARVAVRRGDAVTRWTMPRRALPLDESPGSPWLLLPPDARRAFDRVAAAGPPLARSAVGRPHLGVKSGCNDAFLVRELDAGSGRDVARVVDSSGRAGDVERALLRRVVRGERVTRWRLPSDDGRIIWPADDAGRPLDSLPPHAARWLAPWRRQLAGRSDARGSGRCWWSLFRVEAAAPTPARVVWSDLARTPRAAVLRGGDRTVPLNSCYVVHCAGENGGDHDAFAFAALLNAPLCAAWLDAVAEPARGGYHRYLGWTVALLPTPRDWPRASALLAPLGRRGFAGDASVDDELDAATLAAFGLRERDVAALLDWHRQGVVVAPAPSPDESRTALACVATT